MNRHNTALSSCLVILVLLVQSVVVVPKTCAQPAGPAANFVQAVMDESGEFAYFRMRGTRSTPREAVKLKLGEGETDPQFVEIVGVDCDEYQAAAAHTMQSGYVAGKLGVTMGDGSRFVYLFRNSRVEKRAPGSQDKIGEIEIPNSPGYLRAAGCVLKDELRGHVYVGTARGPSDPAQVVKLLAGNTSDSPTLVGAITLESNESNISCGMVDPVNGYAYFGTKCSVVKVALGDPLDPPTRVGAVSLKSHECDVALALIDLERRFAYFANDDTVVKIVLGDDAAAPRLVGSITLRKPQYGEYTAFLLIPAVLPLLLAFILPTSPWRGKSLNRALLLVFVGSMVASLAQLHLFGVRSLYGSFLAIPPITVPFFFLLPLCQTFLDGVAGGRKMLREHSNTTPWQQFRRILVPSVLLWLMLWLSYLVALELMMSFRFGGGNWIASGVCVALVLGLFSGCVMWAPSCQSLGGLALLAVVWTLATFVSSIAIAVALIAVFDAGGYMGLDYLFAPVGAAGIMLAFSIACGFYVLLRRDKWFDETRK